MGCSSHRPFTQLAGILEADAYAGCNALFHADRLPAPLTRAPWWAHARRYFFELADVATQLKKRRRKMPVISPLAVEAVRRIDTIFDIERAINGRSAPDRLAFRQQHSAPLVAELEVWMHESLSRLSKNSDVAEAMDTCSRHGPPSPPSSTMAASGFRTTPRNEH